MNQPLEAKIEFPMEAVAAVFDISEDELEAALLTGMVKVEQEAVSDRDSPETTGQFQWRLTFGDKVVVMPITLRTLS